MINSVTLIGHLGKDPEVAYGSSEKAYCKFTLATTSGYGDKKETDWHNVVLFGKVAEAAGQYLHKGSLVYIEGRIKYNKWEKDGVTRYSTDIIGFKMQMLGGKNEQTRPAKKSPPPAPPAPPAPTEEPDIEDDLPF